MSEIRLHIGRLVLDGLPLAPHERPLLQAALEAELSRLLAEGGLADQLAQGAALPALGAAPVLLDGPGGPAALGAQIARSVYGSIGAGALSDRGGDPTPTGADQR